MTFFFVTQPMDPYCLGMRSGNVVGSRGERRQSHWGNLRSLLAAELGGSRPAAAWAAA